MLLVRSYDAGRQPAEVYRAYDTAGQALDVPLVPFARSVAGSAVSLEEPSVMDDLERAERGGNLELQPFDTRAAFTGIGQRAGHLLAKSFGVPSAKSRAA